MIDIRTDFRQHLKLFALYVALILLVAIAYVSRLTVLTILVGVGLGVIISPLLNWMHSKLRISRGASTAILALIFLLVLSGIGTGLYLTARPQFSEFVDQVPAIVGKAEKFIGDRVPQLANFKISDHLQQITAGALLTFKNIALVFAGFILTFTVGLFTALRSKEYFAGFLSFFPNYLRDRYQKVGLQSARALRLWFRSQIVVMSVTATLVGLGLLVLGIPFWIVLGILTGVAGFIPYVGAFFAGLVTVLVTLGSAPDKIVWVVALYILVQEIENYVTMPLVMRKESKLPEVPLLLFMLVLGELFGVLGAIIAAPLLAVTRCLYLSLYVPRMNSLTR